MPKTRNAETFTALTTIQQQYFAMLAKKEGTKIRPTPSGKSWFEIKNMSDEETKILIYEEIGFWGVSALDFVKELNSITTPKINVHINSPGGSIFDGLAIYTNLRAHKSEINVHIDALAASAASFIAMAGDNIIMHRNATMMIHDGSGLTWGNEADHLATASLLGKLSNNIADVYSQQANGTVEDWRALMRAETWYTGQEALDAGLVDAITDADEEEEDTPDQGTEENSFTRLTFKYAGRTGAPPPVILPIEPEFDYHAFQRSMLAARLKRGA
jgi:ATP-dependent protease ClpP protease subunit